MSRLGRSIDSPVNRLCATSHVDGDLDRLADHELDEIETYLRHRRDLIVAIRYWRLSRRDLPWSTWEEWNSQLTHQADPNTATEFDSQEEDQPVVANDAPEALWREEISDRPTIGYHRRPRAENHEATADSWGGNLLSDPNSPPSARAIAAVAKAMVLEDGLSEEMTAGTVSSVAIGLSCDRTVAINATRLGLARARRRRAGA